MNNHFESANKQSSDFFADAIKNSGNDIHKMVGYSEYSHIRRFEEMLKLGDFNGKSLLDIGFGTAAFYTFLREKNIHPDYFGTDISEDMIKVAKNLHPALDKKLFLHDIISNDFERTFDFITCIGIINLDFGGSVNNEMTEKLIGQLYKHAETGFAISMTSSLSKKPSPGTYYYKASQIIDFASRICNNFNLSHSYLPNDFTLFCYKNNF